MLLGISLFYAKNYVFADLALDFPPCANGLIDPGIEIPDRDNIC